MKRLELLTTVSHVRHNGGELRVVRIEQPPTHLVAQASYNYYDIHADRPGATCLAAAWALAKRSPRSLVHLPIRANRPPSDIAPPTPPLDLVLLHASAQFRVAAWKSVRARTRSGAGHRFELGTVRDEFPPLDGADFDSARHRGNPHHLRYTTAAETLFVIGSVPAFEREGAYLRTFVEDFDECAASPTHFCVELWPTLWTPGHKRRVGPGGLHIIRETRLWPGPRKAARPLRAARF